MTQTIDYAKSLNCDSINYRFKSTNPINNYKTININWINNSSEIDIRKSYSNDNIKEEVYKQSTISNHTWDESIHYAHEYHKES